MSALPPILTTLWVVLEYTIKILAVGIIPENRRPASSSAWLLLILFLPVVGLPLYLVMGSARVHGRRYDIQQAVTQLALRHTRDLPDAPATANPSEELAGILRMNRQYTGVPCVTGKVENILSDPVDTYDAMVKAIDNAERFVHVEFYIMAWDETTDPFFQALVRAVNRGVTVRLLLDHLGSRKYKGWHRFKKRLSDSGIQWHLMMPLLPWRGMWRRPDLRNHRKILVVDGEHGFIGSHNIIDPHYGSSKNRAIGRRWHDLTVELTGNIVMEAEAIFAMDWYIESGERLNPGPHATREAGDYDVEEPRRLTPDTVRRPSDPVAALADAHRRESTIDAQEDEELAQALLMIQRRAEKEVGGKVNAMQLVPSGPGYRIEPNLRMFTALMYIAKESITITSPYFIPDEALLAAMTSAVARGVRVELFVGEEADQFVVGHAQRSYYNALLEAGVKIYLYPAPAVLHAKYMTVDQRIGVIGSSNMDFRSFSLNYEVMLLAFGGDLDDLLRHNDVTYRSVSRELTLEQWTREPIYRRYVDNVCRLVSGVL